MPKKSLLDLIDIPAPCPEVWDEMTGNDKSRFCGSCERDIYNLSEMTRKETQKLLFESKERVCVRMEREPDGRIKTLKKQFHQITRQTSIAAGVLSATLAVSTFTLAQRQTESGTTVSTRSAEHQDKISSVSFTVADINDAVIQNATVILTNATDEKEITNLSSIEGIANFDSLPQGKYKVRICAPNFASKEFFIEIKQKIEPNIKVNLNVGTMGEVITIETPKSIKKYENLNRKTSSISFTVYDPREIGMPNAEVKLINQKTKQEFTVQTNNMGVSEFKSLPHGRYKAQASARGFSNYQQGFEIKESTEPNVEIILSISSMVGVVSIADYEVPLFQAIARNDNEVVKKIIASGFNVNTKNSDKNTALHIAAEHGNVEIVKSLLDAGAKVNVKNKSKQTPILVVGSRSADDDKSVLDILRLLIAKGADVNVQNEDKQTLLMSACEAKYLEAVRSLLEAGANPNIKDSDGETAFDKTNSLEIKNLLIKFGARNTKK